MRLKLPCHHLRCLLSTHKLAVLETNQSNKDPIVLLLIVITLSGIALGLNNLWTSILLIPAIILCHFVLMVPEERYLKNKFGGVYLEYIASLRRWFGRKRTNPH